VAQEGYTSCGVFAGKRGETHLRIPEYNPEVLIVLFEEFDRQVEKGNPRAAGLSEEIDLDTGRLPFVIAIQHHLVSTEQARKRPNPAGFGLLYQQNCIVMQASSA
jgi:hypothetical protein